jgi:UDP-N-acetylglucosamine 2-epimerase (non-hydrolysing)
MVDQVMQLFELSADQDLEIMQAKQTLTDITCRSLRGLETVFQEIGPKLVIVQGDTTTAFAATLAAFYQQIPLVMWKPDCVPMICLILIQRRQTGV